MRLLFAHGRPPAFRCVSSQRFLRYRWPRCRVLPFGRCLDAGGPARGPSRGFGTPQSSTSGYAAWLPPLKGVAPATRVATLPVGVGARRGDSRASNSLMGPGARVADDADRWRGSQLRSQTLPNPGAFRAIRHRPAVALTSDASRDADKPGRPRTKIGQLVMRRSSVRIRQGAPWQTPGQISDPGFLFSGGTP